MKTTFKKSLAIVLVMIMLFCTLLITASAKIYSGTCGDKLKWFLDTSTGVFKISGAGSMEDYSFETTPWYLYRGYIKSVNIPDGVTTIGEYAFYDCSSLTSITIPNSVTAIGDSAFKYCSSLTSVTIPDGIISIGNNVFYSCYNLISVTIPNSVITIGDFAFDSCNKLKNVTIGDSVTTIGFAAFSYCYSITRLTIPNSVTTIGYGAFKDCDSITDVYYIGTETEWRKISIGLSNEPLTYATVHYHTNHSYTAYTTTTATCTNPGTKTYSCYCGNDYTVTLAANGHVIGEWEYIGGNKYAKLCTVCGKKIEITEFLINELKFKQPSLTTINYGETLVLQLENVELPEGYAIEWSLTGDSVTLTTSEDGKECRATSIAAGNVTVTATLVDENGESVINAIGNEIFVNINLKSNVSFWQKIVSFFKDLFGMNRIIY